MKNIRKTKQNNTSGISHSFWSLLGIKMASLVQPILKFQFIANLLLMFSLPPVIARLLLKGLRVMRKYNLLFYSSPLFQSPFLLCKVGDGKSYWSNSVVAASLIMNDWSLMPSTSQVSM